MKYLHSEGIAGMCSGPLVMSHTSPFRRTWSHRAWKLKAHLKCQLQGNILQGKKCHHPICIICSKSETFVWHYVFNRKSNGSWGQAVETRVTPRTITLSDSPGECGLHRVRGHTPKKGHTVAKGQSKDPTEPRAMVALGTLNSPCFKTRRQGKSYGLGRAVAPNQPVEVPAFVEWREGRIHMELNFLLHLLVLPCPVITVDGHVQWLGLERVWLPAAQIPQEQRSGSHH